MTALARNGPTARRLLRETRRRRRVCSSAAWPALWV